MLPPPFFTTRTMSDDYYSSDEFWYDVATVDMSDAPHVLPEFEVVADRIDDDFPSYEDVYEDAWWDLAENEYEGHWDRVLSLQGIRDVEQAWKDYADRIGRQPTATEKKLIAEAKRNESVRAAGGTPGPSGGGMSSGSSSNNALNQIASMLGNLAKAFLAPQKPPGSPAMTGNRGVGLNTGVPLNPSARGGITGALQSMGLVQPGPQNTLQLTTAGTVALVVAGVGAGYLAVKALRS